MHWEENERSAEPLGPIIMRLLDFLEVRRDATASVATKQEGDTDDHRRDLQSSCGECAGSALAS